MIEEQCTGCWVIPNHKDIWHVAHCPFYENSMTQKMANCQLDFFEMRDKVTTQEKQIAELKAENERLKNNEMTILDTIADWYYLNPNPQADSDLLKQYENFLTFGQGGANFLESQLLPLQAENDRLRNLPNEILAELPRHAGRASSQRLINRIKEIFAKFAQENGDSMNNGENENA